MRRSTKLFMLAVMTLGTIGCGGSELTEGVPKQVDMTKTYTPAATLPSMTPTDQQKAKAAAAAPIAAPK